MIPTIEASAPTETFPRASVPVAVYREGAICNEVRPAICERELLIQANGERVVTLLCSGIALKELAYGFLYSERVISSVTDVRSCVVDELTMTATFELSAPVDLPTCPTISSGFGGKVLCPQSTAFPSHLELAGEHLFTIDDLIKAVGIMQSFAREYTVTRGIHCSALFNRGVPLASFEDIGRHNTFDKLVGRCLLTGQSAEGALLTTTGRVSSEMVRKALRLGVSGIASMSGPTDQAIEAAREAGLLLAGYVGTSATYVYAGL